MSGDEYGKQDDGRENDRHPIKASEDDLPPFRPFLFLKHSLGIAEGESTEQYRRHQYSETEDGNLAQCLDRIDLCWRRLTSVDGQAWMVIFTAAMVLTSVLQWNAIRNQNEELIRQTNSMVEQTELAKAQLKGAEDASKQTDAMIKEMQLEKRAWIAAMPAVPVVDLQNPWFVILRNSGGTPGRITHAAVISHFPDNPNNISEGLKVAQAACEEKAMQKSADIVVAPDIPINYAMHPDDVKATFANEDLTNPKDFVLFGYFKYTDVWGEQHETKCCFIYYSEDNLFVTTDEPGMNDMN